MCLQDLKIGRLIQFASPGVSVAAGGTANFTRNPSRYGFIVSPRTVTSSNTEAVRWVVGGTTLVVFNVYGGQNLVTIKDYGKIIQEACSFVNSGVGIVYDVTELLLPDHIFDAGYETMLGYI